MAQGVFVITEQRDNAFRKVSFEAVSEGRRIADGLGANMTAVVVGSGIEGLAAELEKYGPDKILVADDAALADAIIGLLDSPTDPEILRSRAGFFTVSRAVDGYERILSGRDAAG